MSTLKVKPWWLQLVVPPYAWVTISPNVYTPDNIDVSRYPEIIAHENTHLAQQNAMGKYKWLFRYFISRDFRLDQEAKAIAVELAYLPKEFRASRLSSYAEALSSKLYWWAASSKEQATSVINTQFAIREALHDPKN